MRLRHFFLALVLTAEAAAQTYKPKQIRLEGADGLDKADILHTLNLKEGTAMSKTEIETALQRLADSGAFTDVSYTVNDSTLIITLKPAEGAQALPVRFSNFVWWQPAELEALVEKRVPLFHGKLPLTGELTKEVIAALSALVAEKGVPDAKISAGLSTSEGSGNGVSSIALTITSPQIILGDIKLLGAAPNVRSQLDVVSSKLAGQEFDSVESAAAIRNSIADTHKNVGYLDAAVDAPEFGAPHLDMLSYEVDASVLVHPGELYHVSSLDLNVPPPVTSEEAARVTGLRVGQAAGAMYFKIAAESLARAYASHGFLETHITAASDHNKANHTVAYRFSIDPGVLDHVTSINGSALSLEQRETFAEQFQGKPGAPADAAMVQEILRVLHAMHAEKSIHISQRLNRKTHTVEILLEPVKQP